MAGPALSLEIKKNYYELSNKFEYLVDDKGVLTIDQISDQALMLPFTHSEFNKPSPKEINIPIWLKLELDFSSVKQGKNYVLTTLVGDYKDIRIYRPNHHGLYEEYVTGNVYPASQREIKASRYAFYLNPAIEQQTIFLRISGRISTYQLPWVLVEEQIYEEGAYHFWFFNLICIGALLGILIFNIGIGATLRSFSYLFYSFYVFCGILLFTNLDGSAFLLLWPNFPEFNSVTKDIFTLGISATRLLIILSFLNIKEVSPHLYKLGQLWLSAIALMIFFICAFATKNIPVFFTGIVWVLSMLFGLSIIIYAIKNKVLLSIPLFFIILIPPVVGGIAQGTLELGFLEQWVLPLPYAMIAFVFHALLFSICLALQFKHEVDARIIAQHDSLTGLPTMLLARDRFLKATALARRYRWKLAILFIDLDRFKAVNDTHGHEVGDKLLIEVAHRISSCLREVDTAARMGGDEFLIIQTEIRDESAVTRVAEKLNKCLSLPFTIEDRNIQIGASIGIALFPDHGEELNGLIKNADQAMYKIKKKSKSDFYLYQ